MCRESGATAAWVNVASFRAPSRIVPLPRDRLFASMLTPSRSRSLKTTLYSNLTVEPETLRYSAVRFCPPTLSVNRGVPVTTTVSLNVTATSMESSTA